MRPSRTFALALLLQSSIAGAAAANDEPRWFSSSGIVELQLEAPFGELFAKAQQEDDYEVMGRLSYVKPGSEGPIGIPGVQISTRGHSSRQTSECDFPKLKLHFKEEAPSGSMFAGTRTLKLGTHCADRDERELTRKFGRLANQKAPHREALVYALLEAVRVPVLRSRPVRIAYVFTDGPSADRAPLVRNALLLEDDDEAMKRFGATIQLAEDRFDTALSTFDEADTARLAFAEAMVGNFDWCLRFYPGDQYRCDDRHPLWNVLGLARDDGWTLPLVYDLDLSGMVVGRHIWFSQVFDESFVPSGSRVQVEVLAQLQRTRSLFGRETLDRTRTAFLDRKDAAYRAIAESVADDGGRALATAYLDAFFTVIGNDAQFYSPVVVGENVQAHLDSAGTQAACADRSTVPAGTPVSAPLAVEGDMVRVRLLDALWQWTPPRPCDVIHHEPVWIPRSAVDANYPR